MARSEQHYITLCKKQIEKRFMFGNGHGYTQRDLEILSRHIEEKTSVCISLSTLKRLWKNDFKQSPQLATLNALAVILDYKDWQDFKQQANQNESSHSFHRVNWWLVAGFILLVIAGLSFGRFYDKNEKAVNARMPVIHGPVHFSAEKTVVSGIPNTVIFKYDVSNVEADNFYIQQTWNPNHRFLIDPKGNTLSNIYYESGYHRARLMANDSVISMQPIHILSKGWEPHLYYSDNDLIPIDFTNESFVVNGQLHLEKSLLEKRNIDFTKRFYSRITNSQEFNVSSDNFSLVARMKSDSSFSSLCPWMNMMVVTEKHIFYVALQKKGCERNAAYKLGEIIRNGEDSDLSALGCDVYDWQEVCISVRNKNAQILINDKAVFKEVFTEDFGKVVALTYIFEGTGSLDCVQLKGADEQPVIEDHFE
jgi:transcriptional regulator with XRE-family HTH domain